MVASSFKNEHLTALLQASVQGDAAAYRQFLNEISHDLSRFLRPRMPLTDVEDVVQEILLSIHKARHTYDGKRSALPWVFAIARFRLTDYLRKHYAKRDHQKVDMDTVPQSALLQKDVTEGGEAYEYIDELIQTLPEREQRILQLMHYDGYTAREVGSQLGMKESAVKVAAHRTYNKIRKELGLKT